MENYKDIAQYAVEALKRAGAQEAECYVRTDSITEVSVDGGDFSLMRTYGADNATLYALKDNKLSKFPCANIKKETIDEAVAGCIDSLNTAKADDKNDITRHSEQKHFVKGPIECDHDTFLRRILEYAEKYQARKGIALDEYAPAHVRSRYAYCNSLGAQLSADQGFYRLGSYTTGASTETLDQPLSDRLDYYEPYDPKLLDEPVKPLGGKFEGTLIYTPTFTRQEWWLAMLILFRNMSEEDVIERRWNKQIGEMVADPRFNLSNRPEDPRFSAAPVFTNEGVLCKNVDFIKDGRLLTVPAARTEARKLGIEPNMPAVDNDIEDIIHGNFVIDPGTESINDIIKGISRGIIINRIPGAVPSDSKEGTINSVIRGGLLIENGVVTRPVSEVLVSGGFYDKFKNIRGISSEYRAAGGDITPWIAYDGFTMQ